MADNISEKDKFLRFVAFFVDIGTETVLKVFYYCQQQDPGIITFPISSSVAKRLRKLPGHQYDIIESAQNPETFDLSILIALLCSLFFDVLPYPLNGWGSIPDPTDLSISADLLRLRYIRNEIFAHCNTASLSNDNFETYWKEVEDSLRRIYTFIQAGNIQEFEDKVKTYRHTTIEATHAELCFESLKNQITEIRRELQEFSVLLKKKQGPYFPYIKLLLEGGRCCLFAYLNTLTQKQNKTLSTILSDNRTLLLQELGDNHKLVNQIYPDDDPTQINTKTENWDLYVLAVVIITVFGNSIKDKELKKVKTFRNLRRNYVYTAVYAVSNNRRFKKDCEDLLICLTTLSESIGGETEGECERLIEEYQTTHPAESAVDVYIIQLKDPDFGFMSINDVHRESLEQLKAQLNVKESVDINLNDEYELEIIILLKCEDMTKIAEAEHAVHEFIKALFGKPEGLTQASPDYPEVQKTIETINGIPSVKVKCVKKSCLLLTIECQSKQGLLSLINYVDSVEFQQHLDNISNELTAQFDEVFILQGHFTVESLQRVLTNREMEQFHISTAPGKVQATQEEILREREDTEKDLNNKLKQQLSQTRSLEHELSAFKRQNKDLEIELVGHGQDAARKEKDEFKRKVEQFEVELVQSQQHYLQSQHIIERQEYKNSSLKEELMATNKALNRALFDKEVLDQQRQEVDEAHAKAKMAKTEREDELHKIHSEEDALTKMQALNEGLGRDKIELNRIIMQMEADIATVYDEKEALERERTKIHEELVYVKQENMYLDTENAGLKQTLEQILKRENTEQLKAVGHGQDAAQREKDELKRKVEQLQVQLVQSEQHYLQGKHHCQSIWKASH